MGRRQKPYRTSWGELIDGLYRAPDGRWKIIATGERFTEKDEFTAVSRFKQRATDRNTIFIPSRLERGKPQGWNIGHTVADVTSPSAEDETGRTGHLIDEQKMWEIVRKVIIEQPELAAQKLRIPQIVSLKSLQLPIAPLRLDKIIEVFETKNPGKPKSKRQTLEPLRNLIAFTKANTLEDLTTEKLQEWREDTETRLVSPDWRRE